MRKQHVLAALVVTAGLSTVPAAASAAAPAATTWAGWDAPGPLGVGSPTHVTASGGTTAILGRNGSERFVSLAVTSATGSRLGLVPVTGGSGPTSVQIAAAGPDRLLLADHCRIGHSEDRGLTWSWAEALAGCSGEAPQLRAVSAEVAFAWTATRTWRTTDGGATWPVVNASERGPEVAVDQNVGFRIVAAGPTAYALQRTTDGGASWQGLKVPPVSPVDPPTPAPPEPVPTDPPAPSDPPAPLPMTPPAPTMLDSVPMMRGLARRADGAIIVGVGDQLLVSTDNGATFTRTAVPIPDDLPGSGGVVVEDIVCDPGGTCVVGVHAANDAKRRSALRLVGGAFDARVAALPQSEAAAPAPGVVVGRGAPASEGGPVVRTDDYGATPYAQLASGARTAGNFGVHGVLALANVGRLHVSTDGGQAWNTVPLPATPSFRRVASQAGALVALADDGSIRRFVGGAWQRQADVSAIRPADMAVAGGVPIVVGSRGIVRLTDPAAPKPVSAPILQGRGFSDVEAAGRTVLAWARKGKGYLVVRSTDAGKTWKKSKLPAGANDVQVVNATTTFVLAGRTLMRSTDGGKRFVRQSIAPDLGAAGPQRNDTLTKLEFSSATTGVLITPVGAFVTRDAGRTLSVLPTPGAATPPVAAVFGSGVTIQDDELGAVFRSPSLLKAKAPTLTLRAAGKVSRRKGVRTVTVIGVLRGAGDDEPVAVLGVRKPGADAVRIKTVVPNADGSFRVRVRLAKSVRGVQAWYRGAVRPASTSMSSTSKVLRVR
jgi:hypothetical protein